MTEDDLQEGVLLAFQQLMLEGWQPIDDTYRYHQARTKIVQRFVQNVGWPALGRKDILKASRLARGYSTMLVDRKLI